MKRYLIYYNFSIKDPKDDSIVQSDKGTFEMEFENKGAIDGDKIRSKIFKIAEEYRSKANYYVEHHNYYRIEEISWEGE